MSTWMQVFFDSSRMQHKGRKAITLVVVFCCLISVIMKFGIYAVRVVAVFIIIRLCSGASKVTDKWGEGDEDGDPLSALYRLAATPLPRHAHVDPARTAAMARPQPTRRGSIMPKIEPTEMVGERNANDLFAREGCKS